MEAADPEERRDVWHRGALALWRYEEAPYE